jgi:hypothetical protein
MVESWSHGYYQNLGHLFLLSPGFAQTEDGGPLPERRPVLLELNGRDTDFICGRLDRRLLPYLVITVTRLAVATGGKII